MVDVHNEPFLLFVVHKHRHRSILPKPSHSAMDCSSVEKKNAPIDTPSTRCTS